jgi:hypothetical protein
MRTPTRTAIGALGALALVITLALPAAADPVDNPFAEGMTLDCDHLGTVDVLVVQNDGQYSPGLVTDSHRVLLPYAFRWETSYLDGPVQVDEYGKPAPDSGRLDACTFHIETDHLVADATVWVSYTRDAPAGRP